MGNRGKKVSTAVEYFLDSSLGNTSSLVVSEDKGGKKYDTLFEIGDIKASDGTISELKQILSSVVMSEHRKLWKYKNKIYKLKVNDEITCEQTKKEYSLQSNEQFLRRQENS